MRYLYCSNIRSKERAEEILVEALGSGDVVEGEKPKIERMVDVPNRWKITLDDSSSG